MDQHLTESEQMRLKLIMDDLQTAYSGLEQLEREVVADAKRTIREAKHQIGGVISNLWYDWPPGQD